MMTAEYTETDGRFINEFGIVHEVDPRTLSIKALIPSIDPNRVHDQWITQMVPWVGQPGYGPAFAPAVGSEVLITGRYGGTYTLYYLGRYNTRNTMPQEFSDGSRGCKCDTILRLLCDVLMEIKSQTQVLIEAGQRVDVDAPDVRVKSGGAESLHAQGNKIAFLGADPIARRTLPTDAVDLATNNALTNALKQLLKDVGLAQ
jgi:hypothetical protein